MAEGTVLFIRGEKGRQPTDEQSSEPEDDIWDDTALVKAYDKAVNLAKEEVVRRMGLGKDSASAEEGTSIQKNSKKKKKRSKKDAPKWKIGAPCCAKFSGDGVWYEATIVTLLPETQSCVVKYVGYNNEEKLHLNQLKCSKGEAARKKQELEAQTAEDGYTMQNGIDMLDMEYSEGESGREMKYKPGSIPKLHHGTRMEWDSPSVPPLHGGFIPQSMPLRLPPMGVPPMMVAPPPPPHLTASFPEEDAEALSAMLMSWYMSGFHTGYYQGLRQGRNSPNDRNSSRTSSRR